MPAFVLLGLVAFISPQVGVHHQLDQRKQQLLNESSKQIETMIMSTLAVVRSGDLEQIDRNESALSSLEETYKLLERISTWPWKSETRARVLMALLLPLVTWPAPYFLGELLTR